MVYRRPGCDFVSLQDVLQSQYRICTYNGAVLVQLRQSNHSVSKLVLRKLEESGIIVASLVDAITHLQCEDKIAVLVGREHAELLVRTQPQVYAMLQTPYLPRHYAFATPRGSPLCRKLSRCVLELMEEGKVDHFYQKYCHKLQ